MAVLIHNIECVVPKTVYDQAFVRERMKVWLGCDRRLSRILESIYNHTDIARRHSVIENADDFFRANGNGAFSEPTTRQRNDMFTAAAREIYTEAARRAIGSCASIKAADITHVVTVSCTGFFNPGPDYEITRSLGLNPDVQRYNIGFMGCYAAFPALRLAHSICLANASATVLVVACELCTLHAQLKTDTDSITAAALFADGAAAALVSAKPPAANFPSLELSHFHSTLIPESEGDMSWTIGDAGFEMTLSQYVPKILQANVPEILSPILNRFGMTVARIDHWAIHPGGKSILDKIASSLGIDGKLEASRRVLRDYGNMSSATVLFVLRRILDMEQAKPEESVVSMAFGPGLTVEFALMKKVAAQEVAANHADAAAGD